MRPKKILAEELVKQIIGKKAAKLSDKELEKLVACFMDGGRQALMSLTGTARQAADVLGYTRDLRSNARRQFARKTAKPTKTRFIASEWQYIQNILDANKELLSTWPGVLGSSPSFRIRKSQTLTERTATIFIKKKVLSDQLPDQDLLPSVLKANGGEVAVDIVEVGDIELQAAAGISVGDITNWGTIGTYAYDNDSGQVVALTAYHVANHNGNFNAPRLGEPGTVTLGSLLRSRNDGTDAAAILVDSPPSFPFTIAGIGQVRGWRPVHDPADRGIGVKLYGANSGALSGHIINPCATWYTPEYQDAILASTPTDHGDSGAALLDSDNYVLGLLIGRAKDNSFALFTPFDLVLEKLRCFLPTS